MQIGRPSYLRHTNALTILRLLREAGSCSRADLVRASGLSAPTVTNVVKDLQSANLVEPLGEGQSSGGRPPDMIRFKAERGCILSVDISANQLFFLLTDLNGYELEMHTVSLAKQLTTPEAICVHMSKILRVLLRKQKMTREQLLVMVVGVPAIVNVQDGIVLSNSTLDGWHSVPLRAMLRGIAPCLSIVENDTNLAAQGERYRGAARNEKDFILISISAFVGSGIVVNGKIHHGFQWSAGEIGYMRLPHIARRAPTIHEFGALETVLGSKGIVASWREADRSPGRDKGIYPRRINAEEILNLAQAGDARAGRIIQQRAEIVADIIVNLSLVLNPALILLSGEVGSHPELLRRVHKQLQGSEFAVTRVAAGDLGSSAVAWGGISTALDLIPTLLLPQPST